MPPRVTESSPLLAELTWRGLIAERSTGVEARLAKGPISAYIGFDPSARSLHVGQLLQVFMLTHLQRAGGTPFVIVGGGTGMIGDPSGKSSERNLLDDEQITANAAAIRGQLERFVDFSVGPTAAQMVDNRDWLGRYGLIEFLRDIGKHFSVPYMLAKESVQQRLAAGMSFTEFSYMTLQAADFLHLYRERGVEMQMGGADQWGNITAGLELIRKVVGREEGEEPPAFGLCSPLLLTGDGRKMGKSERGAVFLDPWMTTPYEFYQYWLNDDDALVVQHLKWLTLLTASEVAAIESAHLASPEIRQAQRTLALDLTKRVHDPDEALDQAEIARLQERKLPLEERHLERLHRYADSIARLDTTDPTEFLVANHIASGRSDATRQLSAGVYLNGVRLEPESDIVPSMGGWIVIRVGTRHWSTNVTTFRPEVIDPLLAELRDVLGHYDVLARRRALSGVAERPTLEQFIIPLLKSFGAKEFNLESPSSADIVTWTSSGEKVIVEVKRLGKPIGTVEQLSQVERYARSEGATLALLTNFDEMVTAELRDDHLTISRRASRGHYEELWRSLASAEDRFGALLRGR